MLNITNIDEVARILKAQYGDDKTSVDVPCVKSQGAGLVHSENTVFIECGAATVALKVSQKPSPAGIRKGTTVRIDLSAGTVTKAVGAAVAATSSSTPKKAAKASKAPSTRRPSSATSRNGCDAATAAKLRFY